MPRFSSCWRRAARMKASESTTPRVWPDERHPGREMRAIRVDQREEFLGVVVLQAAQRAAAPQVDCQCHSQSLAQPLAGSRQRALHGRGTLGSARMFGPLDHIGFLVRDVDAAVTQAQASFGLPIARHSELEQYSIRATFLGEGTGTLEIFTFTDPEVLEARLDGADRRIDHVAVRVGDLDGARRHAARERRPLLHAPTAARS